MRWPADANRGGAATYTVTHAGGSTPVRVNQEQNGGEWVPLGAFEMAPGQNHRVVLTDDANEYVIGDAVMFVLETNARAVVADAVRIVGESAPVGDFAATSSTVLREYVTLNGQPLALIESGQIQYVHPDHLGTPQKMTDGTGALVWDAVYKPFGEAHAISGSATNPQRFPGQVYDPETGFHYNYFRDYAPGLGRYVESDPIGLDGGLNTYLYAIANPVRYDDPRGLNPVVLALRAALAAAKALKKQIEKGVKWCASWRCKIGIHGPHHYFPELGRKECHVQLTCWRKGAKGSDKHWRWAFRCRDKKQK